MEILHQAIQGLIAQSGLEWTAMLLGLAYLGFIMRENLLAWPCALLSTAIYIWVFWDVSLVMESVLNFYYALMAVYGFWRWSQEPHASHSDVPITVWNYRQHLTAISAVLVLTLCSGYYLQNNSQAAWPYLDSFTTWAAVLTTYMVTQKVFENWIYWFVIDSVSLGLYIERGLYPTALLMLIYLVIIVFGFLKWRTQLLAQQYENAST
ncbi:hypothetical protein TDB9533_01506 [Thalassocella blandensis]|nr:hypothetical protein TDB9533_01506 [Thalassocella blandensis]